MLPVYVIATLEVTVRDAVAVLVPSETEMVLAPPGRLGTLIDTLKSPDAAVVRQPLTTRLSVPLVPPLLVVQDPTVNHATVELPTAVVMVTAFAGLNPEPVMTRVVPTVADVAAVNTPLEIVDRVTVGLAACAV